MSLTTQQQFAAVREPQWCPGCKALVEATLRDFGRGVPGRDGLADHDWRPVCVACGEETEAAKECPACGFIGVLPASLPIGDAAILRCGNPKCRHVYMVLP